SQSRQDHSLIPLSGNLPMSTETVIPYDAPATHPGPSAEAAEKLDHLIERLRHILPADALLTDSEDTSPFESDGLSLYKTRPPVVALPENEAQVIAVLDVCREFRVPVVPRGAGTGLSGGALPHEQGVLLGLSKLNRIKSIDRESATAIVEPGVRNLAISEAAQPY